MLCFPSGDAAVCAILRAPDDMFRAKNCEGHSRLDLRYSIARPWVPEATKRIEFFFCLKLRSATPAQVRAELKSERLMAETSNQSLQKMAKSQSELEAELRRATEQADAVGSCWMGGVRMYRATFACAAT